MSTAASSEVGLAGRRSLWASAGFIMLLALGLFWPGPVLKLNDAVLDASLNIDGESFLGREAPSWDVAFWCIAGLFTLGLFHGRTSEAREGWRALTAEFVGVPRAVSSVVSSIRVKMLLVGFVSAVITVAAVWLFLDSPLMQAAEAVQTDLTRSCIRIFNRLGGGMNPAMIVCFFAVVGITAGKRDWIQLSVAMVMAALGGGVLVQLIKLLVGRSRPELWLGPFHHARAAASSFPSGHTVGAFALAGVLVFGSHSKAVRFLAAFVACGIAISRVLAFRHWPSDVVASAMVGTALAWFFSRAVLARISHRPSP
ncbi:MAG TPA: phosphatase PAP2 family protein [Thermoanaerobaculia bacterium]|nr:phosphatase PAP2 family protein [Thermoanaerobaculia bacterium]